MVDRIIAWSLHNRPFVLGLSVIFLAVGGWVAWRMPVDVLPDLTAPTVTILVEGQGMAPTDMEALVTFPIETALNGAAGRAPRPIGDSRGHRGDLGGVRVGSGHLSRTADRKRTCRRRCCRSPPQVDPPTLAPVSSIMGEILFVALRSDRHDAIEMRTIAETQVRRRLLAVPGVSQVVATGGGERQFQVIVSAEPIRQY